MLEKLLGVASVGSTLASVGLLHRLLADIAATIMLAIVSAFLLCALTVGGFILAFCGLVHYGLDPYVAGIGLGLLLLVVDGILLTFALKRIRNLRAIHTNIGSSGMEALGIQGILESFIDGFLNPPPKPKPRF